MSLFANLRLAYAVFLAAHYLASTPLRAKLVGAFGEKAYLALYSLAAFATLGWMMDRRKGATLGEDWKRFAGVTSNLPFAAIAAGRNRFDAAEIGRAKPALGLALYAALVFLHPLIFGVRPY